MTEQQWLAATDPVPMLEFLRSSGKASERKLRLFVVACCRHADQLFPTERGQSILETAEWFAEGLSAAELWEAMAAGEVLDAPTGSESWALMMGLPPWWRMLMALQPGTTHVLPQLLRWLARAVGWAAHDADAALRAPPGEDLHVARHARAAALRAADAEQRVQCDLLRDIFRPFHPLQFDPAWRTFEVIALARDIYEQRDFARLPGLADVLERHGCADAELVAHLRGPGPHVRGCAVLDVLLDNR